MLVGVIRWRSGCLTPFPRETVSPVGFGVPGVSGTEVAGSS